MTRVFISYSHKDSEFVDRLVDSLNTAGVATWRDMVDIPKDIAANTLGWRNAVEKALRECTHMIVALSPESVESPEVAAEWNWFIRQGRPVYPVQCKDCDIPYRLDALQTFDLRIDYDGALRRLIVLLPHISSHEEAYTLDVVPILSDVPGTQPLSQTLKPVTDVELDRFGRGEVDWNNVDEDLLGFSRASGLDIDALRNQHPVPRVLALDASDVLEILPPPFEWCPIPAGRVTLADNAGAFNVAPFWMAKYPITYAQFQVFVDANDGFTNPDWWTGMNAPANLQGQPGDQNWKIDNHPRDTVSWYDAIAFCQWLNAQLGLQACPANLTLESLPTYQGIRLPTEWEWQWAAQGPDGRAYPWGKIYFEGFANINETYDTVGHNNLRQTTPVGKYPQGASQYGVLDMIGNVWEWCMNEYRSPEVIGLGGRGAKHNRVQRGGSWHSARVMAHCSYRNRFNPNMRNVYGYGFRIVQGGGSLSPTL